MKKPDLKGELERLRIQLEEARETLEAIRTGAVDALVVSGVEGEQVYTLRGADHPYRLLLQEMNEGAATLMPDGTLLYCNSRFAEMLKRPMEQLIGSCTRDLVAPADRSLFAGLLRRGWRDRAKAEISFAPAAGGTIPVYCSVSPLKIADQKCLCLVATDLTQQKRSEAILASEKLARRILERAIDVIVVCDENGVITHASGTAHELAGTNVLQQSFEKMFPLVDSEERSLSAAPAEGENGSLASFCLGGRTVHGMEVELRRVDGKKFDLLLSAGALRDAHEQPRGCVFTLTDITRMKRTEEALRESEQRLRRQAQELEQQLIATGRLVSLGEITASMAHEFNNPLGIVMGFAEDLLSEKPPSDPDYQALKIIFAETKRCEKIIRDLLQFARPRQSDFGPTDVRSLVAATMELVDNHLYKQKIKAETLIEEDLPEIHADRQQLEQVLVNLYLNAIDAMPQGGALVVRAVRSPDGCRVAISVTDTGIGIGAEDLPKIFQPFFSTGKKSGLGLGLPICQKIVKNHSGEIEVDSQAGKGTTFRISLPLAPALESGRSEAAGA